MEIGIRWKKKNSSALELLSKAILGERSILGDAASMGTENNAAKRGVLSIEYLP